MIKTIIKIAIAALVIHACWRSSIVAMRYYKFKDAVHETVLFSASKPDAEIQARVLELAQQLEVPVLPEHVEVRRQANRTIVDAAYTEQVELVPTKFYPWDFKMEVEAFNPNMPGPGDITAPGR